MPIVSDFIHIQGDGNGDPGSNVRIGDGNIVREWTFQTGGRHANGTAYIVLMVKGMTVTDNHAEVRLNNQHLGYILNNKGGSVNEWQTQILSFTGDRLNNGSNELEIHGVTYTGGGNDNFDDFYLRNIICHFHQSA